MLTFILGPHSISFNFTTLALYPVLIILSFLPKSFRPFISLLGILAALAATSCVIYYSVEDATTPDVDWSSLRINSLPVFLSIATFSLTTHGVIIPQVYF